MVLRWNKLIEKNWFALGKKDQEPSQSQKAQGNVAKKVSSKKLNKCIMSDRFHQHCRCINKAITGAGWRLMAAFKSTSREWCTGNFWHNCSFCTSAFFCTNTLFHPSQLSAVSTAIWIALWRKRWQKLNVSPSVDYCNVWIAAAPSNTVAPWLVLFGDAAWARYPPLWAPFELIFSKRPLKLHSQGTSSTSLNAILISPAKPHISYEVKLKPRYSPWH